MENVLVGVNDAGEVIINFISSSKHALVLDNNMSTWVRDTIDCIGNRYSQARHGCRVFKRMGDSYL